MKLFAVTNGNSDSDFDLHKKLLDDEWADADDREKGYMIADGSNAHSGGQLFLLRILREQEIFYNKKLIEGVSDYSGCSWYTEEDKKRRESEIEELNSRKKSLYNRRIGMNNELKIKMEDVIRHRVDSENLNKIVDMLRHIHNDVEIVKKEIFLARHQMVGTGYALHDISLGNEISEEQIDDIINTSPDALTEANGGYTAIDEKDKEEWEKIKYMQNEKFAFGFKGE